MRLALIVAAVLTLAAPLFADDARARKVKVALALAEAKADAHAKKDADRAAKVAVALELAGFPSPPAFVTVPTVAPAPMPRLKVTVCDCDSTGECKCPPGGCACCDRPLPDYATQASAAVRLGKPLVCYVGCKGHCLDGALACESKADGTDAPGVEVLIPKTNGNLWSAFRLPCDATPEAIKAAVQSAAKALAAQPKSPATPAKMSAAPGVAGSVPFTVTTPARGAGGISTSSSGFSIQAGTSIGALPAGMRGSISGSFCVGRA